MSSRRVSAVVKSHLRTTTAADGTPPSVLEAATSLSKRSCSDLGLKDEMLAAIVNKLQESNKGEASEGEDDERAQGDDEWAQGEGEDAQGEGEEAQEERAQALDIDEKVEVKPELGDVELKRLQLQVQLKKMEKEFKLKEFELETKRMELELAEKEKARKFELEEKERQRQFELAEKERERQERERERQEKERERQEKEKERQHELEVLKLGGGERPSTFDPVRNSKMVPKFNKKK
ncbi:uncharacterized protein [Macrobrachium rosenbergii]|uniref:uncharacterized protein n=1 Tax=Macrobrachium rosenbergii TaxID=79674 RepID=UPI0034D5956C